MSRTRSRQFKPLVLKSGYINQPGGMNSTVVIDTGYETITDSNNGKRRPPSSCEHERVRISSPPNGHRIWQSSDYWIQGPFQVLTSLEVASSASYVVTPFFKDYIHVGNGYLDKMTRVAEEVSLLNNVLELPDLGDFILKYKSIGEHFANWNKRGRDLPLPNYLDYEFGIAPLVRDMNTLRSNISRLKDNVQRLSSGKPFEVSHTAFRPVSYSHGYGTSSYLNFTGTMTGTVSGEVEAFMPGLSEIDFQLNCFLDMIGLHIDPLVAYDAIPFSWLVDWFLPLGDALKQLNDRKWVKVDLNGQAYITAKAHLSFQTSHSPSPNPQGWAWYSFEPGSGEYLRYKRIAVNYGRSSRSKKIEPRIPDFDNRKVAILASLAQARKIRR